MKVNRKRKRNGGKERKKRNIRRRKRKRKSIYIYISMILQFLFIMMAELNENFYSTKTHKYPPSSFLLLLGNSNCGMQQKNTFGS